MSFDLSTTARNRSDLDKLELCCPDQLINAYSFSLNNNFDGKMSKKWLNIFKFPVMIMTLVHYFGKCIEKKKNLNQLVSSMELQVWQWGIHLIQSRQRCKHNVDSKQKECSDHLQRQSRHRESEGSIGILCTNPFLCCY